jgi:hypothetical protein
MVRSCYSMHLFKRLIWLKSPGDLLDKDTRLRELGPAPARSHRNVYNWMRRHRPLEKGHDDFIRRSEDFIAPIKKNQQGNGIHDFIEAIISRRPQCPLKVSASKMKKKGQSAFHIVKANILTLPRRRSSASRSRPKVKKR